MDTVLKTSTYLLLPLFHKKGKMESADESRPDRFLQHQLMINNWIEDGFHISLWNEFDYNGPRTNNHVES